MKYFEDISLNLLEIFQKSQTGKGFIKSHDDSALRVLIENLTQNSPRLRDCLPRGQATVWRRNFSLKMLIIKHFH